MINAYYRTGQNAELFTANLANVSNSLQNGKGTLGMLLTDSIMANQFRNTLDSLETTLGNTSQTTQNLMEFSNMLKNEKGTIGKLLTDTVMAQQVETSINNINRGTQDLEETVQKVNNSWLLNLFGGKDKDKKKDESLR
jgi:phospholipid/cholesterol/gamma-HCH transport system substrate-binding protein